MDEIRISGKVLSEINMPDFCARCWYIKQKMKKVPFSFFPGIFSSLDIFSKKVTHFWIDNNFQMQQPLYPELKDVTGYLPCPHWSKFKRTDPLTGITVSGTMDDLFTLRDGSLAIIDNKTAKYTANADKLFPLYQGQLAAYRYIQMGLDTRPVSKLSLVYFEPVTDVESINQQTFIPGGVKMGFKITSIRVEIDESLPLILLEKAKDIISMKKPPKGVDGCKDCLAVDELVELIKK